MNDFFKLVISIGVCQGAGILGSIFVAPMIDTWYEGLVKPAFSPPSWVFGPVWVTLYTLMGISLYLVWRSRKASEGECNVCESMSLFLLQLALNVLWTYLFFWLQEPLVAFIEIVLLLCVVLLTIWRFWYSSKVAAYLLIPYAVWIVFAAVLNFSIWQLN